MKITIVGAGRVGLHLAKYFVDEHQDVFLVDDDRNRLSIAESDFNLRTFAGDPLDFNILREANSGRADVFVAVTASAASNMMACAMAKSLGAKETIARIDKFDFLQQSNLEVIRRMGVDHVVHPDHLAALSLISSLTHSWSYGWNDFDNGAIVMAAVAVNEDSAIAGRYLKEMYRENRMIHISALKRNGKTIIPHGDDMIMAGDILYITTVPEGIERVKEVTSKEDREIKRVILMGGSNVAELAARMAGRQFSLVIVEKNLERCRYLTETCTDARIIYGDGSEQDVLDEAGINRCDAFVALSDNSESNILGCFMAHDEGVVRTIAEVEKEQYIATAESFGIGAIINKPIITANAIFQLILESDASSSRCFAMKDAEVTRMVINEDSHLTKGPVSSLRLPKELNFAGLIRDGKGQTVTGSTVFQPGDSVIVFCLNGAMQKVEKLFRK